LQLSDVGVVLEMQLLDPTAHSEWIYAFNFLQHHSQWLESVHTACILHFDASNDTSLLTFMHHPFLHVLTAMHSQ